jgi:5-formyltetrahydrofolate cyclo-ligase
VKRELRKKLRQILDNLNSEELHDRSFQACHNLIETREYQHSETLMVFMSLPREVNTSSLVHQAWRDRKRILVPKVSWEQRRMMAIEIDSLSDNMNQSQFGIREPTTGTPVPIDNIDMVIVPGLGFDTTGNRIGRGKGFYDGFLAHDDWHGIACGLAFSDQVIDSVPVIEKDITMNMLVTDKEVYRF